MSSRRINAGTPLLNIFGSALAALLSLTFASQSLADSEGKFPGKGSYESWLKAADASEDGVDYARKGNYTMAVRCYEEAIQLYPYDASFYFNKATALKKQDKQKEAVDFFKKALELEPAFASAWYNMGNALEDLHDMNGAENAYRHTVKIDPKHLHAWFNLGENLLTQKKYEDARDALERARDLPGSDQDRKDIDKYLEQIERDSRKE